ncbi:hypothetical protein GWK36_00340 [Caldichromatium japonicum]|uniref:Uncharacterized protein n=1 Tax=Caldichromatium japonicum TaxID=2699430 RepID=A0A6G7V9P4_9GAMM|nr:hypothetical protein [Caldichromatium japonicum]QIK36704.1 hypothetical protein GWK36_00340 [Caldichromatium japonicum]
MPPFSDRLVDQLLWLIVLSSLAVWLWSGWKQDQLPPPSFYDLSRLVEPRQTRTLLEPFTIESQGVRYRLVPHFDYELDGVVVSLHDSDVFWDIYHRKDWQDFINIRDLCVVWGENLASGVFRAMHYKNTTWTCWISTADPEAARRFAWDWLANNHLLSHIELVQRAIKSARVGDQIYLRGQLVSYSNDRGFQRGTSTRRDDTGDGACETIHVEDFKIIRRANPGWRLVRRIAGWSLGLGLLALTLMFLFAPYRPRRSSY